MQEFLNLQSEEVFSLLETILQKEKPTIDVRVFEHITEEFNERIDQSESDFRNNKYKMSAELLAKLFGLNLQKVNKKKFFSFTAEFVNPEVATKKSRELITHLKD
ncbi:hypothetical protein ABIB40_004063 [Pedobacter sp. UYP30]|uniref:hypothetical protein n=1 Tax=Pedobacter sp. UYP30 TaxID=1756400 RepID=UPI003395F907